MKTKHYEIVNGDTNEVIEGGFFSRAIAQETCEIEYNKSYCAEHDTITGPYFVRVQA